MLLKIEFFMSLAGCPKVEVIGGKSIFPSSDEQRKLEVHNFEDFTAIIKSMYNGSLHQSLICFH